MMRGRDGELAAVTVPAEALAQALGRHPRYKVLRLADAARRNEPRQRNLSELTVAVIDVETTGFDQREDAVIELGIQRIKVDESGRVVETGRTYNWLEDPGRPIPPEITRHTGISDADVAGRSIMDAEAFSLLSSADAILAHNAAFDRPFVDRRLELPPRPWICSLQDLDWSANGFECRKLGCLLHRCGGFHEPHRASDDVNALVKLLEHRLESGDTVMRQLIRNASRPNWLIEAPETPFALNAILRERGYGWDQVRRQRWRFLADEALVEAEISWLVNDVYAGSREPVVTRMTWRERYALR
ncbi:DNA polymerase-3 subunit epsilon [Sphingomonas guangdongensis]|uniref:DNA polymerase-3 subunit epsilon n=1 Tax=Sphingomonas guangdongensis TaxID=1141890 RepID=A0A285QFS0_9SPHN|nr:3'-5' exonuclease [Sphingomonas guangdongensis]SOB80676.1 DNA polymerase-3 subunit epsilon [Sphingomonas guangdongensis]